LSVEPASLTPQASPLRRIEPGDFYAQHVPATLLPIIAAALVYGWAALGTIALVVVSAWAAGAVWSGIGRRGRQLNLPQSLWMSLLLALALPPHLLASPEGWAIVPAAGVLVVVLAWLLGPLGSGRVQPALAAYLVLMMLFAPMLGARYVLKPNHLFLGNLRDAEPVTDAARSTPWVLGGDFQREGAQALDNKQPAVACLTDYTSGRMEPDRFSVSALMLVRDKLPPLEDIIIGGEPTPIGLASAAAVILGGLYLLFRHLIDWRIPLYTALAAEAAFLVLPIPVAITDLEARWRWFSLGSHQLGWAVAVTLANYELLASPLLFVAFFWATSPRIQPVNPRARTIFGICLGLLCAPAQLYGSAAVGPYVMLLALSPFSPYFDRILTPRRAG
jgi:Na+-translocating ferredoxin:NAD+ oxidoreductase RnfD subunit